MEKYFYFGEATVETTGESALFPLSSLLGMTPSGAAGTKLHFAARNGSLNDDTVELEHANKTVKQFATEIAGLLQRNTRSPFLIISDGASDKHALRHAKVTTVSVATAA
tara:strand:+ start:423 stop:749 length:327 start_codon:yes stop_codon:yes gene_type:complete